MVGSLRVLAMQGIRVWVPLTCVAFTLVASAHTKHWTITANGTIWRGRYKNCDHGYVVDLAPGVVGHSSLPPSPNHGILISAASPGLATEVTLEESRLLSVYDSTDALDLGSAQAYLNETELKPTDPSEIVTLIERHSAKFRRFRALYVHFRKTQKLRVSEVEELIVYRAPKEIGALFIVVRLQTAPESYRHDHALFVQVRDGLRFAPVPKSRCSND